MQSSHFAPVEGDIQEIDWARFWAILQSTQSAGQGRGPYETYRSRDVEEGGTADDSSTSAAGSSPAGSVSPREQQQVGGPFPVPYLTRSPNQPQPQANQHTGRNASAHSNPRQHTPAGVPNTGTQSRALPNPFLASFSWESQATTFAAGPERRVDPEGRGAHGDPDATSVSAAAERHRLISESSGVNLQVLAEWLADLVPFVLLLGWVFIFKHLGTLVLILLMSGCTLRGNADIRRLIALRREARPAACVSQALSVCAQAAIALAFTMPDSRLVRVLSLSSEPARSAVDALLLVILADSIVRFSSLAPKLLVVAWFRIKQCQPAAGAGAVVALGSSCAGALAGSAGAGGLLSGGLFRGLFRGLRFGSGSLAGLRGFGAAGNGASVVAPGGLHHLTGARQQRQQSRVLTAVERTVSLYRAVLPGPVWYGYLLKGGGFSPVLASLLCGFYLALKASSVAAQGRLLLLAIRTATRQSALYGTYVGRDSDASERESGTFGACPVCQDPVTTPVRLDCGHIFCEECILEWLERDRTCPMCRAQVRPAGLPSCSDGASPLLPQCF